MGHRIPRSIRPWPLLLVLLAALVLAPQAAHAQDISLAPPADCIPPGPGVAAGFGIDGYLICGVAPPGTAEDWFSISQSCVGVLLNNPFGAPNPARLPALFSRDSTSNSIGPLAHDVTVFSGTSNKNDDLIGSGQAPWTWDDGSTPPKDDLSEIYLHVRTDINGHLWIILGNAYVSTDGDKHVDYEFNLAGIQQTGSLPDGGQLIGLGPDGGRTANKDFVISLDYVNGGTQACVSLRRWNGAAYDSIAIPAGEAFSAINQVAVDVPGDVMTTLSQYSVTRQYEAHQFAEAAVDISALLPDVTPSEFCSPTSTVLVKTRSSQSFTAELKDFALLHFNIIEPPSLSASNNGPACVGGSITLSATVDPTGGTFAWTGPNGFTSNAQNPVLSPVTLAMAGKYYITYTTSDGCTALDSTTVVVNTASASASNNGPACVGGSITLSATGTPAGGTFAWSGPNGFTSTLQNPTLSNVTLAMAGTYTVTYTSSAGCVATATTNVVINSASVTNANNGPLCVGQTLNLTATGTPAGGSYAWTGPNGFSSALQNPSITNVQLVNAGNYIVTYTSTAGCIAKDTTTVVVGSAGVTASNSGPACVGGSINLTATGSPAGGTFAWSGPNGFSSALQNPTLSNVTLAMAGTYTVTYTSPSGCVGTNTTTVVINSASVTNANNGPLCVGQTLNLTATGTPAGGTYAWTGPNGFSSALQNPSIANVQLVNAGNYIVTYTSAAGCVAKDTTTVVVGSAGVTASNSGPACVGGSINLTATGSPAGGTFVWSGPNGFSSNLQNPTLSNVTLAMAGTYTVTYTSPSGCVGTNTTTVVINTASVTAGNNGPKCVGQQVCLSATGTPAGGTYAWSGPSGFSSALQNPCISNLTAANAGTYTVTYTSPGGCTATNTTSVTVNPLPTCSLTAPEPLPQCTSPGNQLCATNLTNVATYLWTVTSGDNSWQITAGSDQSCVTYTAGNGGTEGTFKLVVTSAAGCKDSCTVTFGCQSSQLFCTLTQGAYGNPNGMFQGLRRLALIQSLITPQNPLVIGKTTDQASPFVAARSVTFADGSEQCVIDRLPAGGPATTLPSALGNATIDPSTCNTSPTALPLFNGKFRNVFLGQLITLSLNARLGQGNLGGLTICKTMVSVGSILDSNGDPIPDPNDPGKTFFLPTRIFTALANLGLPKTVGGLIELANRGIAGQNTDVATIDDLNMAVSAINEGLDGCRFVTQCLDGETEPITAGGGGEVIDESVALPREFAVSASAPNPFNHLTTLRLSLPERSSVQLSVYNILGQEIARIADGEFGAGVQTVQWNAASRRGDPVAPGVYFFRVKANGLESGRQFTRTQKVLYIR